MGSIQKATTKRQSAPGPHGPRDATRIGDRPLRVEVPALSRLQTFDARRPTPGLDDAYGFPVCDSGASCIDLNPELHLSACSLVQARSTRATQPQPPERLDLTVSANDVMFSFPILEHGAVECSAHYHRGCWMVGRKMKRPALRSGSQPRLLDGWRF